MSTTAMPSPDVPSGRLDVGLDASAAATLCGWMAQRRWFMGKARRVEGCQIAAVVRLGDDLVDVLVDVRYADGGHERYQVPLTSAAADDAELQLGLSDGTSIDVRDAVADPASARRLASLSAAVVDLPAGDLGVVQGMPVPGVRARVGSEARLLSGEQSNSSVIVTGDGDPLILKVLRRLESGVHPDVELTRALTETGFAHVPAQIGSLQLRSGRTQTALTVLSAFVIGAQDGFEAAVDETSALVSDPSLLDGGDVPPMLGRMEALGAAVGQLHTMLARVLDRQAAGPSDLSSWSHAMREQLQTVAARCRDANPEAADQLDRVSGELRDAIDEVRSLPLHDLGLMIRIHGDLHLGQTLWHDELGWQVLDFEGEPAKPLEERRAPSSPLRDVAGMVRSLDYAAAAGAVRAGRAPSELPEALSVWRDRARDAFLVGYSRTAPGEVADLDANAPLLTAFELDKAVYELGYELANRPSWVPIPIAGIMRAVERRRRRGGDDPAVDGAAAPGSHGGEDP